MRRVHSTAGLMATVVVVLAVVVAGALSSAWAGEGDSAVDEAVEQPRQEVAEAGEAAEAAASEVKAGVRVAEAAASVTEPRQPEPRSLPEQERQMPGGVPALIAYLVLWGLFGGYLFFVHRRQRRLNAEIEALEDRIDKLLGTGPSG